VIPRFLFRLFTVIIKFSRAAHKIDDMLKLVENGIRLIVWICIEPVYGCMSRINILADPYRNSSGKWIPKSLRGSVYDLPSRPDSVTLP